MKVKSSPFTIRNTCRLCGSTNLFKSVPLKPIPVVSPNVGETSAEITELLRVTAPLDIYSCHACGLMQLTTVVDPHLQYDTFMYETSVSLGLSEHFSQLADILLSQLKNKQNSLVIEIGSNDGTLLEYFKSKGAAVLGVDPARQIAEKATARGIPTRADFFTETLAREISREHGRADIVISNNTLANLDDLTDMVEGVRTCLAPEGVFVFETQYALDVLDKTLLDVIYHEHLTYFSIKPLIKFFAAKGFEVFEAERIWPKGGSIRVYVQLAGGGRAIHPSVAELSALEEKSGLYSQALYEHFSQKLNTIALKIAAAVETAEKESREIAVYGSSVGCASLINQFDLNQKIAFIVDDTPFKKTLTGPNYQIPVVSREQLAARNPALVIVLAWRYAEPIRLKNTEYLKKGGRFLIPFPDVHFIDARA